MPDETLKSKRSDSLTLYTTKTGNFYLPSDAHQDIIANAIKNDEIFDEEIIICAKKYIIPGSTVLDVGTNFGQMSVLFSKMVGNNGIVYSFEADNFIFETLKRNIEANDCKNVVPVYGAVHDIANATLYFPEQDFDRFGTYGSYGIDYINKTGREVPTVTIDSQNIGTKISFMKIDIQGGDLNALRGAEETIRRNQMPILFEFEYVFQDELKLDFQDYVDFVQHIGYKFQRVIYGANFLIVPK
ncbi:MAG: FkbM family methyltransferase [Segetibacter sp.]